VTTWMVVEDEPDFYELVLAIYDTLGVDGLAFTTGEEAISWIEDVDAGQLVTTIDELPQLALLDIRLPGDIGGVEVSRRLRESPVLGNIAIVLMTAYKLSTKVENDMIKEAGCDLLLHKPLPKLADFKSQLQGVIAQRMRQ
jgi:CheY-like chemotaxis protein